jgi:hypothetical protein
MKKLILTVTTVAVVGLAVNSAHAGDHEWATVGKVLTGVTAGVVLAKALDCQSSYTSVSYGSVAPGYQVSYAVGTPHPCPPPVVYAPAPVVYQPVYCAPRPVYYAPAPVYHVNYATPGRGHGHGHGRGHGRW